MGMSLDTARFPRDTFLDPSQGAHRRRRRLSGQRLSTARESVQMDVYIRSKPIHRDEPQIAAEISRILNIEPGRSGKVSVGENPRAEMKSDQPIERVGDRTQNLPSVLGSHWHESLGRCSDPPSSCTYMSK